MGNDIKYNFFYTIIVHNINFLHGLQKWNSLPCNLYYNIMNTL